MSNKKQSYKNNTNTTNVNANTTNANTIIPQNEIIPLTPSLTSCPCPSQNTECSICAEPYNKKSRLLVKCPYCDFESCRECSQKYIVEQPVARCMNPECAKEWTRGFLRTAFTAKFINTTYKEARERILYEHEISLLPATQYLVEREIQKEQITQEIMKLYEKQDELRKQISKLQIRYNRIAIGDDTETVETNEHTLYVRKCSDPDCRGFLSSQWKCGVCNKWTCNKCHENIGPDRNNTDHTCNPDNVATAKLIAKETKPCPKCKSNIFKIDGCDQMWCTQCNTAFSWKTGQIVLDQIHNPHYFEWIRTYGGRRFLEQQRGDTCNRRIRFDNFFEKQNEHIMDEMMLCIEIYRNMVHNQRVEIPRFNFDKTIPNRNLRVEYMRKFISDDKFKILIQQNDKRHQKHRDITNILNMLHDTVNDILIRLLSTPGTLTKDTMLGYLGEIEEIVKYANGCLEEVSHTYSSVKYVFNNKLHMRTIK